MPNQNLQALVSQGLQALKQGGEVAKKATAEIHNDATDPALKEALQQGNKVSEQWAQRIDRALKEAGGDDNVGNPVLEALYEVSKKIRQKAHDATSRDLGIIAAGQIALHYWIATFGTLATYASALDLQQVKQAMQTSLDEAKQADQQHTQLAEKILQQAG